MGAVERVVWLVLQIRVDRLVVRHEADVHRRDVTGIDEARRCVPRCGDPVVPALAHQLHHLVGRAGHLDVDLATGCLLEVRFPRVRDVAGPGDKVQLALALAHALGHVGVAAGARRRAPTSGREQHRDQSGGYQPGRPHRATGGLSSHCGCSLRVCSVTATECSGRHPTVAFRPRCSSASEEDVSRF